MAAKFTSSQQSAIDVTDRSLILSAGAGAGKTSTLIERIFRLLTNPQRRCTLEDMLVVTFSRAAAQEMKSRLAERLKHAMKDETIDEATSEHIEEQVFQLPRASISTIHSFCLDLITANPETIGMAPGFDLMSEEEARLIHRDFVAEKIEETLKANDEDAAALRRILDLFDPITGMDRLIALVVQFHHFLNTLPNPDDFAGRCFELYTKEGRTRLNELVSASIRDEIAGLRKCLAAMLRINRSTLQPAVADQWNAARGMTEQLDEVVSSSDPSAHLDALLGMDFPRLGRRKKEADIDADIRFLELRDKIKERLKKVAARIGCFAPSCIAEDLCSSQRILRTFTNHMGLAWSRELFQHHLELRRITFSHLEQLALRLLVKPDGTPTDIALGYRARYLHVLVDEFQDVNEMQDRIIKSVAERSFVVGDVKQSIYEFRLAEPELFIERYRASSSDIRTPDRAPGRINLQENFRSAPALLQEFNGIFSHLLQEGTIGVDYDDGHAFIPGRQEKEGNRHTARLSLSVLPAEKDVDLEDEQSLSAEAEFVADSILRIGPPWRDVCILLRSAVGCAHLLVDALERRGIPVYTEAKLGFLTAVEVVEFQALLRTINNPYDDLSLLGALRGPAARWSEEDLLELRMIDSRAALYDNLIIGASRGLSRAADFLAMLQRWQDQSTRLSMRDFFALLFDETHLLERAAVRPNGDQRRRNLVHLLAQAENFDRFLRKGLREFLRFLDDLIENGEDFSPPTALPDEADVVRIMTIHKSKGMEFPVVVYPFTGRRFNMRNQASPVLYDRHVGIATKLRDERSDREDLPPLYQLLRTRRKRKDLCEELRLVYVALTRAKEAVFISGASSAGRDLLLEAASESDRLDPAEVFAANCPMEWFLQTMGRRLSAHLAADSDHVADGAAEVHLYDEASLKQTLSVRTADTESTSLHAATPAIWAAGIDEAIDRIRALDERPSPPMVRAKLSVSEVKRAFEAVRDPETPPMQSPRFHEENNRAWMPAFLKGSAPASSVQRGTATHRFLALCDLIPLSRGERKLTNERDRLVSEGLLQPEEGALLDLPAIQWFLNSDIGKRVRRQDAHLHRERPFTIRVDGGDIHHHAAGEPVVLQGVVDLITREPAGWLLIDYKTDFCGNEGERLPALRESYGTQMRLYRQLVERSLGEPVHEAWLVFLQARSAHRVPLEIDQEIAWEKVVESGAVIHAEPHKRPPALRGV